MNAASASLYNTLRVVSTLARTSIARSLIGSTTGSRRVASTVITSGVSFATMGVTSETDVVSNETRSSSITP